MEVKLYGRLNRRRFTVSRDRLTAEVPSLNLEQIEVQDTRPTEPSARVAANVTLRWLSEDDQDGDELNLDELNEGESVLISPQQRIRAKLEKRQVGWFGETWWLVVLILLALTVWAGMFGYLYWTS